MTERQEYALNAAILAVQVACVAAGIWGVRAIIRHRRHPTT